MIDIQFHLKKKKEKKLSGTGAQQKIKVILNTSFLNQENAQNEPLVESHKKKELTFTFVC